MKHVKHWQDPVNVALGAWLIISPWVLGFQGVTAAMWSAVLTGVLLGAVALGATLVPLRFPAADGGQAVRDWAPHCAVEAAVAHAGTYPSRGNAYGPVLAAVLESGRALSGPDYQRILLRRMALRGKVDALFTGIDALLTPVQPMAPLTLHAISTLGTQPGLVAALQRYTCLFDMTGHPCLTLPAGQCGAGMPMGIQLVAARLDEATLLQLGAAFQTATQWHLRRPLP
ncbi:Glutamyl-tRNA(Gln) amidotransferase subunit A [compost metagenome]